MPTPEKHMKNQEREKPLSAAVILCLALAGCGGEFAYKRGAGVHDLNTAKNECQAKGLQGNAFAQCMEDNGWVFHNPQDSLDDDDPVIKASLKNDYRDTSTVQEQGPVAANTAITETGAAKETPPPVPKSPMDIFTVSSWWKIGKGAENLKSDIQQCVAKLGPEHQPDMSGTTAKATRGLLLCMREMGWKALQAQ